MDLLPDLVNHEVAGLEQLIFLCGTGRPGAVNEGSGAGPFCALERSLNGLGTERESGALLSETRRLDPSKQILATRWISGILCHWLEHKRGTGVSQYKNHNK